jgi:hypothetical protein
LLATIDQEPHTVGVHSANWTTERLADYLAAQTGYRAGIETVRKRLHRADYVCKRPTWTLQRKAEEQPEWAKKPEGGGAPRGRGLAVASTTPGRARTGPLVQRSAAPRGSLHEQAAGVAPSGRPVPAG